MLTKTWLASASHPSLADKKNVGDSFKKVKASIYFKHSHHPEVETGNTDERKFFLSFLGGFETLKRV